MTSYIVYGTGEGDGKIKMYVENMLNVLKQYSIDVNLATLSNWDSHVHYKTTVVYIVSIENEKFHDEVKPKFLQGLPNCVVVLLHTAVDEKHVKKFRTSVKTSLKKKEQTKPILKMRIKNMMDRILCVNDLENLSQWWPHVLKLLFKTKVVSSGRAEREIGVFFKIDLDDETQVKWLEWQRTTLENTFKVRCRQNDGLMSEETYIKYSKCVVMYVDRKLYQRLGSESARQEGKKKMLESIRETRDACDRHGTMFQIFVDEAGVKLTNALASDYGLKMVGDGMMFHWLELLHILSLIRVRKITDTRFYSTKDQNEQEVFRSEKYPYLFRKAFSPREGIERQATLSGIEAQTLRHAGSVKGVCYQSTGTFVTELDDIIPRYSAVCCNWLNIPQQRPY